MSNLLKVWSRGLRPGVRSRGEGLRPVPLQDRAARGCAWGPWFSHRRGSRQRFAICLYDRLMNNWILMDEFPLDILTTSFMILKYIPFYKVTQLVLMNVYHVRKEEGVNGAGSSRSLQNSRPTWPPQAHSPIRHWKKGKHEAKHLSATHGIFIFCFIFFTCCGDLFVFD